MTLERLYYLAATGAALATMVSAIVTLLRGAGWL